MPDLLAALDAFLQEHRRCGDRDGGVEGERVWMSCDCGAVIARRLPPMGPDLQSAVSLASVGYTGWG
jgi:hypothetical protein